MKTQTFTGTVLDTAGDPWEDALVELQMDDGTGEVSIAGPVVTGVTDASGDFSIDAYNNSDEEQTLLIRLPNGNLFSVAVDPEDDTVALGDLESSGGTDTVKLSAIPSAGGGGSVPVKATGAEVDTGTNDAKFLTPLAIEDSSYIKDTGIAPAINAATAKTAIVDADLIGQVDTEAANVLKKVTWTSIKAFLKTYFDTLYDAAGAAAAKIGGSTGATDNAILRANGTGGSSAQESLVTIDDSGTLNIPTDQSLKIAGSRVITRSSGAGNISINEDGLAYNLMVKAPGGVYFGAGAGVGVSNASNVFTFPYTYTPGGTTGNRTINKPTGSVNIAAGGSSVTVTDSSVASTSIVFAVVMTNDATALIKNVVVSAGSFVITMNAAVTAETKIGFWVVN